MLQVNDEDPYPHFFHLFGANMVQSVQFSGHALINFIGFGPKGTIVLLNLDTVNVVPCFRSHSCS